MCAQYNSLKLLNSTSDLNVCPMQPQAHGLILFGLIIELEIIVKLKYYNLNQNYQIVLGLVLVSKVS